MKENNLKENQIYIYREKTANNKSFFSGFLFVMYCLDSIFFGYFRDLIEKIVVLKDFTVSGREEFLVYTCLAIGVFLIAYSYSNYKSPIISVSKETIVLGSKEKRLQDLIFYEFTQRNKLAFHFSQEIISIEVDSVNKESLREALDRL